MRLRTVGAAVRKDWANSGGRIDDGRHLAGSEVCTSAVPTPILSTQTVLMTQ